MPSPIAANLSITLAGGASLHAYFPSQGPPPDIAVIVVPGGSYRPGPYGWCKTAEGSDVAVWLASVGVVGIVLHYRLPAGRPLVPLADASNAITAVKSGLGPLPTPALVGIMGFSAGGHLAALASTRFAGRSTRPDLTLLFYPLVSMATENYTHANSRREYLGAKPSPQLVEEFSADRQLTARSPPAFLVHAQDDRVVSVKSSQLYYDACIASSVPCAFVQMDSGGHPWVNKPQVWLPARTAALTWMCATLLHLGHERTRAPTPTGPPTLPSVRAPSGCEQVEGRGALRARLLRLHGVASVSLYRPPDTLY